MSALVVIDTVDQALVMVDRAYSALSAAVDFQGTRQVRNLAVAAAAFASEAKDTRLLSRATELRARAERKAGAMLREAAEKGQRATRDGNVNQHSRVSKGATPTLAEIGITRDQSSAWQAVAKLSENEFEAAVETTKAVTHSITTPRVVHAAKQAKARDIPMVDSDEVAPLPEPKAASHKEQALSFYNAVRALGALTCTAAELRVALPSYQHFRILENVGPAQTLLQKVSKTWTT